MRRTLMRLLHTVGDRWRAERVSATDRLVIASTFWLDTLRH